ncbi:MAG: hypothetical protein V3S49_04905 [Thermodesulfobacteriota bacterium]
MENDIVEVTEGNDIVEFKEKDIAAYFSQGGTQPLIDQLQAIADHFEKDISTESGRKKVASFAYKISRFKTKVNAAGKDLVYDKKQEIKIVDSECKRFREEVDIIKDRVRLPLTEWENVDKVRIEDIKTWIQDIVTMGEVEYGSLEELQQSIDKLKAIKIEEPIDITYCEFAGLAVCKVQTAITNMSAMYIVRKKADDNAVEAQRLEAKRIEDDRVVRDKEVAKQAAEDARVQAEEEAAEVAKENRRLTEEKDRIAKGAIVKAEAEKAMAMMMAAKAERQKREAEEKARKDAEEAQEKAEEDKATAIKAEKKRVEDEKKAEEDARLKREADLKLRSKIIEDIIEDLSKLDLIGVQLKDLAEALIAGKVRHVKVNF